MKPEKEKQLVYYGAALLQLVLVLVGIVVSTKKQAELAARKDWKIYKKTYKMQGKQAAKAVKAAKARKVSR